MELPSFIKNLFSKPSPTPSLSNHYIRCPHCDTLYALYRTVELTSLGEVRCGTCGEMFVGANNISEPKNKISISADPKTHQSRLSRRIPKTQTPETFTLPQISSAILAEQSQPINTLLASAEPHAEELPAEDILLEQEPQQQPLIEELPLTEESTQSLQIEPEPIVVESFATADPEPEAAVVQASSSVEPELEDPIEQLVLIDAAEEQLQVEPLTVIEQEPEVSPIELLASTEAELEENPTESFISANIEAEQIWVKPFSTTQAEPETIPVEVFSSAEPNVTEELAEQLPLASAEIIEEPITPSATATVIKETNIEQFSAIQETATYTSQTKITEFEPVQHITPASLENVAGPFVLTDDPIEKSPIYQDVRASAEEKAKEAHKPAGPQKYFPQKYFRESLLKHLQGFRWVYATAGLLVAINLLIGSVVWLNRDTFSQNTFLRGWLTAACEQVGCTLPIYQDPSKILVQEHHLVADPSNPQLLQLNALIENISSYAQPLATLQMDIDDLQGVLVNSLLFTPEQYAQGATKMVLEPGQSLQISVTITQPTPDIFSYELRFK